MSTFVDLYTDLLNIGGQDATGDALAMAKGSLNRAYRRVLALSGQASSTREFNVTTVAGVAATVTSSNTENFTITGSSNDAFSVAVNGGPTVAITLTAGTRTAAQIARNINDDGPGGLSASVSSGAVVLTSDLPTSEGSIQIVAVSNDAYTILGFTAATTTGTGGSKYGLGPYVKRVLNIDDRDNNRQVFPITKADYDGQYPGSTTTGDPRKYYILGVFGVNAQPTSASALSFTSDASTDTGTIRVTGFVSGVYTHESITLNGTSAVVTTNSYATVERITKLQSDTTVHIGTVTATSNSASVTVVVIPFHMDSPSHLWLEFYPISSQARYYTVRAEMNKPNLINDADWPDIDEDFHNAILYLAAGEVLPAFGNEGLAARMFEDGKDEIEALLGKRVSRNIIRQFIDVTTSAGTGPQRPLIAGIDIN